jgi:hypothetical protein
MVLSFQRIIYQGLCACAALAIASCAILPVSAATANAMGYRGGQVCAQGCHNTTTACTGGFGCSAQPITACFSGPNDANRKSCGGDSGICTAQGCNGADVTCR